nr:serine/arginine repetitive matrix protein 2-like [Ipomoea batatas]
MQSDGENENPAGADANLSQHLQQLLNRRIVLRLIDTKLRLASTLRRKPAPPPPPTAAMQTARSPKISANSSSNFATASGDQHTIGRLPVGPPFGSSATPGQTKTIGKRHMEAVEVETSGDAPVIDPKKAQLARWESQLAQTLTRGTISLPDMFNLLFQLSPPAASLVNETIDYVGAQFAHHLSQVLALAASTRAELFVRARLDAMEHEGELRKLKEKDAAAHYASRPADLPGLLSTLCPSEDAALPLFYTLRQDPVGLMMLRRVTAWGYHRGKHVMQKSLYQTLEDVLPEDWEQVRAVLPAEIPPPSPELFSDPPTGLSTFTAASRNQDP